MRIVALFFSFLFVSFSYSQEKQFMFSYDFQDDVLFCDEEIVDTSFRICGEIISQTGSCANIDFADPIYVDCNAVESNFLFNLSAPQEIKNFSFISGVEAKKRRFLYSIWPFRYVDGGWQKLLFVSIKVQNQDFSSKRSQQSKNSVLSEGDWFKISIHKTGIYKITYDDLQSLGLNLEDLNPDFLQLYGMPSGMLPLLNSEHRIDGLQEMAIDLVGMNDGSFDVSDKILFYGEGPNVWKLDSNTNRFYHQKHLYSDVSNYFLTLGSQQGKRLGVTELASGFPTHQVNTFDDMRFFEEDKENLLMSGRNWFGSKMYVGNTNSINFSFPNATGEAFISASFVGRGIAPYTCSFTINGSGLSQQTIGIPSVTGEYISEFAKRIDYESEFLMSSSNPSFDITFNSNTSSSEGWIDYLSINAKRSLKFDGGQLAFLDLESVGESNISEFSIQGYSNVSRVWEVTNPFSVSNVQISSGSFRVNTDSLRKFVAFNEEFEIQTEGVVSNQNLHGMNNVDMVIVSHPLFFDEAQRLSDFHESHKKDFNVEVVTTQQVYNEFSAGAQDVSAIRDFVKMLYDKQNEPPRYLLLFGDGSYDPKNRIPSNTNFVVSYQSSNSTHPVKSYVSDDFFALLDEEESITETLDEVPFLDIGVGRFPVQTIEEAVAMVDKVISYSSEESMGTWRNEVCFVGDDKDWEFDSNHSAQAEDLSDLMQNLDPDLIINKIYIDAYPQESTPGGQRAPIINQAINEQINKGALLINYTGHGGEVGWAHERILGLDDINVWENKNKYPLFVTATCEFSRFDDPARTSAGEYTVLAKDAGAIAMFTTTRVVYSSPNFDLNKSFIEQMFLDSEENEELSMGDLIRNAKNSTVNIANTNHRNFTLLGDPALCLATPKYDIFIDDVNDTLKAFGEYTISGYIGGSNGEILSDFSGIVYPSVYDKPKSHQTLGQDYSPIMEYEIQNNLIFKGAASVDNGEFEFSFVVPQDINYQYGSGKVSLYAKEQLNEWGRDAAGSSHDILIGGTFDNFEVNSEGPIIQLYMNDTMFVDGDMTDENPSLLAVLYDDQGINTVGNGIGHDLVAVLNEDVQNSLILNDYYESDMDTYKSGKVLYPFNDLEVGVHEIKFKAWDVFNNSSEETLNFIVVNNESFTIENLLNYPNPLSDYTHFYFNHNASGQSLSVMLEIFDLQGKLICSQSEDIISSGYNAGPVTWEGVKEYNLVEGIYLYRMIIKNEFGDAIDKSGSLVIIE